MRPDRIETVHMRTQVNSPWTNGKIERFWGTLQMEVLDRQVFRSLAVAAAWLAEKGSLAILDNPEWHEELDAAVQAEAPRT